MLRHTHTHAHTDAHICTRPTHTYTCISPLYTHTFTLAQTHFNPPHPTHTYFHHPSYPTHTFTLILHTYKFTFPTPPPTQSYIHPTLHPIFQPPRPHTCSLFPHTSASLTNSPFQLTCVDFGTAHRGTCTLFWTCRVSACTRGCHDRSPPPVRRWGYSGVGACPLLRGWKWVVVRSRG